MKNNKLSNTTKVAILTLGCSKNVVDSEILSSKLIANGIEIVDYANQANYIIINTCGFIRPAIEESLGVILDTLELKNKNKKIKIIVYGCLVERHDLKSSPDLKNIDFIIGVNNYDKIIKIVTSNNDIINNYERKLLTPPHYAYLKIAEGCNRKCSFCTIPQIRGEYSSRTEEDILTEANQLACNGVLELNIIAQDTTYYGRDIYGMPHLPQILCKLSEIEEIEWIRLLYAYPADFPMEAIDVIANSPKICKYIDIPLQHISDKLLRSMKRGASSKTTVELIEKLREKIPEIVIRSTFIVGYPGETESDFEMLLDFIRKYKIDRLGVFPYYHEPGTSAYKLNDSVPFEVKEERIQRLLAIQEKIALSKNKKMVGKSIRVLIDETNANESLGRTEFDAPEVDRLIHIKENNNIRVGKFHNALITKAESFDLYGEIIE